MEGESVFKGVQVHLLSVRRSCLQVFGKVTDGLALQLLFYGYCKVVLLPSY